MFFLFLFFYKSAYLLGDAVRLFKNAGRAFGLFPSTAGRVKPPVWS